MKKRTFLGRKLTAIILCAAMVISFLPQAAYAESQEKGNQVLAVTQSTNDELTVPKSSSVGDSRTFKSNQKVTVIVDMDVETVLERYEKSNADSFEDYLGSHQSVCDDVQNQVEEIKDQVTDAVADDQVKNAQVLYSYDTVYAGMAIVVPYKELDTIKEVTGVSNAYVASEYSVPETETESVDDSTDMITSKGMISANLVDNDEDLDYSGQGMVVAILDTGISYRHDAFVNSPDDASESADSISNLLSQVNLAAEDDYASENDNGVLTATGDNNDATNVYKSDKVPYGYDYTDHDTEVTPTNSECHGTHVAGIIAGDCDVIQGVAPDAQLMSMKVFDDSGSTNDAILLAALEDACLLQADVINMSLGSPSGFTYETNPVLQTAYDNIQSAGINLDVSAGNNYTSSYNNNYGQYYGYNYQDTKYPDNGIVGSPSTLNASLSVASIENLKIAGNHCITLSDEDSSKVAYYDNCEDDNVFTSLDAGSYEYVNCGTGTESELKAIGDLTGKIALIQRGDITFSEKVQNAYAQNALAVIVYNSQSGTFGMSISNYLIPAVSITKADGLSMIALISADTGTGTFTFDPTEEISVDNPSAMEMSDFSSSGTTPDLSIKPEVTAPGGNIYSSYYLSDETSGTSKYGIMSGTSMAAPHVSGASALVKQYVRETYPDLSDLEQEDMVNTLLMSTADPVAEDEDAGTYYSVRKEGAGLIDVYEAVTTDTYLEVPDSERPKAELGSSTDGVFQFTFDIVNMGANDVSYDLTGIVQAEAYGSLGNGTYLSLQEEESLIGNGATVTYEGDQVSGEQVTVPASGSTEVNVTITLDPENENIQSLQSAYTNGFYVEGYIMAGNDTSDLSLPYLGFYGDWSQADIMTSTVYDYVQDGVFPAYSYGSGLYNPSGSYLYLGSNLFQELVLGESSDLNRDNITISANSVDGENAGIATETYLYRSAQNMTYTVTNDWGRVIDQVSVNNVNKSFYYSSASRVLTAEDMVDDYLDFTAVDSNGRLRRNGNYHLTIEATSVAAKGEEASTQTQTYDFEIDNTAPVVNDKNTYFYQEDGELYLSVNPTDNSYLAGWEVKAYNTTTQKWEQLVTKTFDHTSRDNDGEEYDLGTVEDFTSKGYDTSSLKVAVYDYGYNCTEKEISLSKIPELGKGVITSVVNTEAGTITLTWNEVEDATGYLIYRSTNKTSGYGLIGKVTDGVTYLDQRKLALNKTYYYKVLPYAVGTYKGSPFYVKGTMSDPVSVQNLIPGTCTLYGIYGFGNGTVTLRWEQMNQVSGYEVYRCTSKDGEYTKIATITNNNQATYQDRTSKTRKTTYYYKVRAFVTVGEEKVYGEYSNIRSVYFR